MFKVYAGYDPREAAGFHVFTHSLIARASETVSIVPMGLHLLSGYGVERSPEDSTDFARTRFLAPWIEGTGKHAAEWILFCDGVDMLVLDDITKLWKDADIFDRYAVMCVQHKYTPSKSVKFLGQGNRPYPRKNWSSLMLMNVRRCMEYLTPTKISEATGEYLHRFSWLPDDRLLGQIPKRWNYLVGEENQQGPAKIAHFTNGIPAFKGYETQEYAKEWFDEFQSMCNVQG